jgi:hypothetical protein
MSSQRGSTGLSRITPQPTGVPADYVDSNHPHFPHDSEAQLPSRSSVRASACFGDKWVLIAFSLFFGLGMIIMSLLTGIRIGMSKLPNEHTIVYQTTLTTSTSTGGTVIVTPEMTYIITTAQTIPGRTTPTATVSFIKAPTSLTTVASPQKTCTSKGSWPTIEECRGNCDVPGKRSVCGKWTGGYTCVICPLTDANAFFSSL